MMVLDSPNCHLLLWAAESKIWACKCFLKCPQEATLTLGQFQIRQSKSNFLSWFSGEPLERFKEIIIILCEWDPFFSLSYWECRLLFAWLYHWTEERGMRMGQVKMPQISLFLLKTSCFPWMDAIHVATGPSVPNKLILTVFVLFYGVVEFGTSSSALFHWHHSTCKIFDVITNCSISENYAVGREASQITGNSTYQQTIWGTHKSPTCSKYFSRNHFFEDDKKLSKEYIWCTLSYHHFKC